MIRACSENCEPLLYRCHNKKNGDWEIQRIDFFRIFTTENQ